MWRGSETCRLQCYEDGGRMKERTNRERSARVRGAELQEGKTTSETGEEAARHGGRTK